ncbi:hypothetical protein J5X84_33555 [Streptosporangiaceae bacterium NEAU-GS5]|nr:hypothetical protein [Streptosporangiaceae bacterium NEAU-GS5]
MTTRRKPYPPATISLTTSPGSSAANHTYPRRSPVLTLIIGGVQVLIALPPADQLTTGDLDFATCLAREAAAFARSAESIRDSRAGERGMGAPPEVWTP